MFSWIFSHSQPWLKVFWFTGHSLFEQMSSFNCYCLASAFLTATTKARTIKVPVFLAGDASNKWFTLETVRKFARNSCTCHMKRLKMCCFDLNTLMEQQIGENTRGFCFIFPDKKIVTCLFMFRYFYIEQKWREQEHPGFLGFGRYVLKRIKSFF